MTTPIREALECIARRASDPIMTAEDVEEAVVAALARIEAQEVAQAGKIAALQARVKVLEDALRPELNAKTLEIISNNIEAEHEVGSKQVATALTLLLNWYKRTRALVPGTEVKP